MNAPWYHPTQIDWQDGLNPLAKPRYEEQTNRAVYNALQRPTMVELRNTPGYELRIYAAPDSAFTTLGPGSTYTSLASLPAGSWVIGIGASSVQPEGFLAQIIMPSGVGLFSQPVRSTDISNAAPVFYLPTPQGIPDAGAVTFRLINQSPLANESQLLIWVIQPR